MIYSYYLSIRNPILVLTSHMQGEVLASDFGFVLGEISNLNAIVPALLTDVKEIRKLASAVKSIISTGEDPDPLLVASIAGRSTIDGTPGFLNH